MSKLEKVQKRLFLPFPESWRYSEVKSLSHAQLFATPWTVAYQDPPSMGFSRQDCPVLLLEIQYSVLNNGIQYLGEFFGEFR